MRTPTGTFGTHIDDEVTTTCRVLKITRPDGLVVRYTDHDQDITIPSEAEPATGLYQHEVNIEGAHKAEAIFAITRDENASDGETVTIGSVVYKFVDTLADPYDVKIGLDLAESLTNLRQAINAGTGAGTQYMGGGGFAAHPDVIASLIDIENPQVTPLPGPGGGAGDDSNAIDPNGTGVVKFGNVTVLGNVFDGAVSTFAATPYTVGGSPGVFNSQAARDGAFAGLSFSTPRFITKVRIRAVGHGTSGADFGSVRLDLFDSDDRNTVKADIAIARQP